MSKVIGKWRELIENSWMGLDDHELNSWVNPLMLMSEQDRNNPDIFLLSLMRKPENFPLTCKLLFNVELLPFQNVVLNTLWNTPFPIFMASRGASKSFLGAIYIILRALFLQGRRIIIVGPSFRQSKNVMNYIENTWNNSPILQDLVYSDDFVSGPRHDSDRWTMRIGKSLITALPIGDGEKIRGERANDVWIDEFQSFTSTEILERVVGGFAIVSSSPVEKVKHAARVEKMRELGMLSDEAAADMSKQFVKNQQLISGTAYYEWNHFAKYHAKWKKIIESRGDREILGEVFKTENGTVDIPEGFDWRDYGIIRIPVDLLPKHYMDRSQVARAKATMHVGLYEMEYQTIFVRDSSGFFRASLIDGATATEENIAKWAKAGFKVEPFTAKIAGDPKRKYIYGIDPASEKDNLAITILELHDNHRRVVHCWVLNKEKHRDLVTKGIIEETDYYGYCNRKIRELMRIFPTDHIGIDYQGGGISLIEALHSNNNLKEGEQPIWPAIIEDKEQPTDNYPGPHIIYPVQFANAKWVAEANHGMKKDLEDKKLIFPPLDSISLIEIEGRIDESEEVMFEVEEIKNEMIMIVMSVSQGGTERWDTPEIKTNGKKGRQKKDRYSSLLIANSIARDLEKIKERPLEGSMGGFTNSRNMGGSEGQAPEWYKSVNYHAYL